MQIKNIRFRQEKNLSIAFSIFYLLLGLAIAGFIGVFLRQYLGIMFHHIALMYNPSGSATLDLLDSLLKYLPIALTVSAGVGIIIIAYRSKYE